MKRFLLVCSIFIFSSTSFCFANNRVSNIEIDVQVKDDGSAHITQLWQGTFNEGTENYIPLENMDYKLSNFKVSEKVKEADSNNLITQTQFSDLGTSWNIDASKEQKKFKSGIHKVSGNSIELCWGISYGYHIYELSYDIDPLVKSFTDLDGFNFQFINEGMNTFPTTAEVVIRFENDSLDLTDQNTRAWGFGYEGEVEFWDNAVHCYTREDLSGNDSMTIMVNFDKGLVHPTTQINKTFDNALKKEAFKGSDYTKNDLGVILKIAFVIFHIIVIWVLAIMARQPFLGFFMTIWSTGFIASGLFTGMTSLVFIGIGGTWLFLGTSAWKQLKWSAKFKNINYWRDIPRNEELFISYKCIIPNKVQLKVKEDNLIASMIMVMVQKGNLEPIKETRTKLLGGAVEEVNLKLVSKPQELIYANLYDLLQASAGADGILQKDEIKRIGLLQTKKIEEILRVAEAQGLDECKDNGLGDPTNISKLTPAGVEYMTHLIGLKKYFKDFTLLNERDIQEVGNWQGMLIYATLLDEAKKVMDRLKIMYPQSVEVQSYVNTAYVCHTFGTSLNSGIRAYQAAQRAASVARSGGGGSSSRGGGGGHSGGGHGGGSR